MCWVIILFAFAVVRGQLRAFDLLLTDADGVEGALMQCGDSFHIIMSADVVGRVWGRWVYNQYVAIRDRFSFNH